MINHKEFFSLNEHLYLALLVPIIHCRVDHFHLFIYVSIDWIPAAETKNSTFIHADA